MYFTCSFSLSGENPIIIGPANLEKRNLLDEFYLPRTILLTLASDFTLKCTDTYNSLRQMIHSVCSNDNLGTVAKLCLILTDLKKSVNFIVVEIITYC